MRTRWMVPVALLALGGSLGAQEVQPPAGVTLERVTAGLTLYHGKGACQTCHGDLGLGTPDGPELIGGRWAKGPGTYDWLAHMTRHAGWGVTSRDGDPQPMRGPTVLDSTEVAAVAAYVWSISRGRGVSPSPN